MNTPLKLVIGLGSIGGIAGGGVALSSYLSKEDSIQKQLENDGFRILEKTSEEWNSILNSYKKVIASKSKLKFSGAEVSSKDDLQKRCEETLNKNASENNDTNNYLNQAKKWCIVPTKVEDALQGRRILKLDDSKDEEEDKSEWDEKIKSYTKATNDKKIAEIKFAGNQEITQPNKDNRNLIRAACKKLNEKKSYEADYDTALKSSTDWCSVEKNG